MVFSSTLFLGFFLPLLFIFYFLSPSKFRNAILLLGSFFFYSWGEPKGMLCMLAVIAINYVAAIEIEKARLNSSQLKAKLLLTSAIVLSLSFLVFFKYFNFLTENLNILFALFKLPQLNVPEIALPIGISFYIFQIISYVIDVYRNDVPAQKNPMLLALYLSLFPQLIAGPIVRYSTIMEDIENRQIIPTNIYEGLSRFAVGLAKKVFIADNMGFIADKVFSSAPDSIPTFCAWLGIAAYSLQIYFDFSAYSDMAIGLGRVFNFRFLENFNFPYSAVSMQDFWRRWHISLSSWFKDYLYIPLGGNRISKLRTGINLVAVFVLCGLWHGASWSFVVWGGLHGVGLLAERLGFKKILDKLPPVICNMYVLLFVAVGWVFFRSPTLAYAISYLKVMFVGSSTPLSSYPILLDFTNFSNVWFFLIGIVIAYPLVPKLCSRLREMHGWIVAEAFLFIAAFLFAMTSNYSPFIYFRF